MARMAHKTGEGSIIQGGLGGKGAFPKGQVPYFGSFHVLNLADGNFSCTGPMMGGAQAEVGPSALLQIEGSNVRVVVTSKRYQAYDQGVFAHVGVICREEKVVCVKSTVHFLADFAPIAEDVWYVRSPGAHVTDLETLKYKHVPSSLRFLNSSKKPTAKL